MINSIRIEVIEAARDYKHLLNRGYNQKAVLDLVTSRYGLSSVERTLLLRCIHSDSDAESIRKKRVESVSHMHVVIDGYNVLLTVHTAVEGLNLFLCDDGFVRDLRKSYRRGVVMDSLERVVSLLGVELGRLKPDSVTIVLDKNVSHSAQHAEALRSVVKDLAEVVLADKADTRVIGESGVIASSDYVVILRASRVYDLAGHIVKTHYGDRIIDISQYLRPSKC
ncbi:MAG: DUF434 domain-containing protein [Zestosphaera sp.]